MILTADQHDWFHRMRGDWLKQMRPLSGFGPSGLFPPLVVPPLERLAGCRLLPGREDILRQLPTGGRVAEVGTQEGIFAERIMTICRPDELHLFDIDIAPLRARGERPLLEHAVIREGDSSTLLGRYEVDYFDWIYVDGDHSYDGVIKDIDVARTRVRPGGLLVFNDFTLWSPVECIDYGVPYAVCELSQNFGWDFVFMALHPLMYCDVALRRPEHE